MEVLLFENQCSFPFHPTLHLIMSKFAGLPDIDLTSHDVYETASSPELKPTKLSRGGGGWKGGASDDSSDDDAGPSSRAGKGAAVPGDDRGVVDRQALPAEEARKRFEGSTQVGKKKTATRPRRKQDVASTTPSYLDSDIYELEGATSRSNETPLARLRRLKLETAELEEQLQAQTLSAGPSAPTADGEGSTTRSSGEPAPEVLLTSLRQLQNKLEEMRSGDAKGTSEAATMPARTEIAKELLQALQERGQQLKQQGNGDAVQSSSVLPINSSRRPDLAAIDQRLAALEEVVGSTQGVLEETQALPRPLLPTLARLEHLSTLLTQPRHLDAISKRIKLVASELDRVYESRSRLASIPGAQDSTVAAVSEAGGGFQQTSPLDSITLAKLDDLFVLSSRIQPLLPLAPALLARLRSLAGLHSSASQFSASLTQVERSNEELKTGQDDLGKAVTALEESVASNEVKMKGNLESVMTRMEALERRMKALSS